MPASELFSRNGGKPDELDELDNAVRKMRESQLEFNQSLRESEAQLNAILNNAPAMISLKDTEGRYVHVNSGWERAFGSRNEDVRGKLPEEVLPDSLVQSAQSHDRETLEFDHPSTIEETVRLAGADHALLISKFPVLDLQGKTVGIGAIATDVTERKKAEQEILNLNETLEQRVKDRTRELATANSQLRDELAARKQAEKTASATEKRYRDIVEDAVEGMVQATPEGEFIAVNPAFARMLGYDSPEEVLNSITDIDTQLYADSRRREKLRAMLESCGEITAVESRYRCKDGGVVWLSENVRAVRDRNGKLLRYEAFLQDINDRKLAEIALRESEERLRLAIESAAFGTWTRTIPDDRVILDARTEAIFGLEPGTFDGTLQDYLSRVHPDDRDRIRAGHQNLVDHDESYECDYRIVWPDGSLRYVTSRASLVRNEAGSSRHIIGMLHDITDRKRAETALRESEERFRAVVDNVPVAVYLKDLEGRYLLHNRIYEEWYGISLDEIRGRTTDEFFPAEMAEAFIAQEKRLLESGAVDSMEIDILRKDGSVRPTILIKFPVPSPDGKIAAIGGINIDITERKRAETALRESEERFRAVVDNVPVAVYLKDLEGRYLLHNRIYEEWYGIRPDEIRGRTVDEFFPAEMAEAFIAQDKRVQESGAMISMEMDVRHKDGSVRPTILIKFPIPDPDGKIIAIGGINIDITERKQAEQALHAAQNELLRKERLAALGEFTGTVAHELRNPLGAVAAAAHVLRRKFTGQDADVEKALEFANRGIKRCDNIITELLDFARAKGLQPLPTKLEDWLSALLAEQELPAGVTLRHDFETNDTLACFDPEEMRRAVINLVDNACQAMTGESGVKGQLIVGTRATSERIEIDVTDSGPGIPRDSLARVLEPLYSTKTFGTGLGLPTVQRIMEEHGGGLEIDSEEGQGTQVTLWLRRHQEAWEPPKL
jgi:PAS domain S-box-containing protein